MQLTKLIVGLIGIAMGLAALGQLPRATKQLAKMAVEAQQSSLSLGAWNRTLINGGKISKSHNTSQSN
jgi:hypothetical protein